MTETVVRMQVQFDGFRTRLARIERRFELND
jgi:hypothetical protein